MVILRIEVVKSRDWQWNPRHSSPTLYHHHSILSDYIARDL